MSAARVLVVDDEPIVLNIVSRMLSDAGYEVFSAASPVQALEIVKHPPPIDLLVSDIRMPELLGTQLVQEVARISPQTARLLMTGGVVEPDELPAGVQIIQKPLSATELIAAVRAALSRSGQLRADLADTCKKSAALRRQSKRLISECQAAVAHAMHTQHARAELRGRIDGKSARAELKSPTMTPAAPRLTAREGEVLKLVAEGLTCKQIARQLGIGFKTASTHKGHLLQKFDVHNTVMLVRAAIRCKLIDPWSLRKLGRANTS